MTSARTTPNRLSLRPYAGYAFALATVAAITYVLSLAQTGDPTGAGQGERPYGVLYLLSVALIAMRWGGRQGFFALVCSLVAAKSFLVSPLFSWRIATTRDVWELGALGLVGTILTLALAEQRTTNRRAQGLLDTVSTQQGELQAVLDSMTDGLIVGDLVGNVVTMNPAALRLHGFESVEEARRGIHQFGELFEVFDAEWRPLAVDQWPLARALRGERFSGSELHVRRRDTGNSWDGDFAGTLVLNDEGKPVLVVITVRDVTERRTMERALQISEERLRLAVEEARIGLWHWDLLHDQVLCSVQCKTLFGLPQDEDISLDRFLEALHPDDRDRTRQALATALRTKGRYDVRHRVLHPDGSVHWVASIGHGSYDAGGNALYMEGVAMSIAPPTAAPSVEETALYPAVPNKAVGVPTNKGNLPVPMPE